VHFVKQVIIRDFIPIKGQQSRFDFFFNLQLHTLCSFFIFLLLILSGFVFLGLYNGINEHLISLEEDPFASAIKINTSVTRQQLNILQKQLFFDTKKNFFVIEKSDNTIPVINAIYPYNKLSLHFLKADGKSIFEDTYDVLSVRIPNKKYQLNEADCYIKNWVTKNLCMSKEFFPSEDEGVKNNIILSQSLYKKIGFKTNDINKLPIYFLSVGKYNIEDRDGNFLRPLSQDEKIKYVNKATLFDVATLTPGGDAIISEGFYYNLKQGYYDTAKPMYLFYIKINKGVFEKKDKKHIDNWAYTNFDKECIEKPRLTFNKKMVKIQFHPCLKKEINTKYNIKSKFKKLKKILPDIVLDFKEEPPIYLEQEDKYYYAFLYINKHPKIIDNISGLAHFLEKKFIGDVDDQQVITLRKYRKDMDRMKAISKLFLGNIFVLLLLYIIVTFSLLLQNKRHHIGMIKSMGASTLKIISIYILESFILTLIPLLLSLFICILLEFDILNMSDIIYSINVNWFIKYILAIAGVTLIGSFISAIYIASRYPYQLIAYRK